MSLKTDFLIIGAGPFGLSMAAYANHLDIDYKIVGKPMEFWKKNMPGGMRLRSGPDWHLDPLGEDTILKFLQTKNISSYEISPLPIKLYLEYADWFCKEREIDPINIYITKLDYCSADEYRFKAYLNDKRIIEARFVLIAIGFGYFKYFPKDIAEQITESKYLHTADMIDLSKMKSKSCIIVGGRQSAFEWALLMKEAGANKINIVHRHKTPQFVQSDWSWVTPILAEMINKPDYYLKLSEQEKEQINKRFWKEGRLKLEPWLKDIEKHKDIHIHEQTNISSVGITIDEEIKAILSDGTELIADHLLFATGYKVDLQKVPFLKMGNILEILDTNNGYPKLRANFQSSIPGLYFTSLAATNDFGAFFGFTVSCNTSSLIIGAAIKNLISFS